MDRRELLTSASAGGMAVLAGCADPLFTATNSCSHSIPSDLHSTASDGFPTISVTEEMPKSIREGEYSAAVWVSQQYSEESVAKIEIEVLNDGNSSREDYWGPTPPFNGYRGDKADGDATIWVAPSPPLDSEAGIEHIETAPNDQGGDLSEPIDGCWQVKSVSSPDYERQIQFRPCEKMQQIYSVYAGADNDGCLPAGKYQFEGVYWGFELLVE